MSNLEKKYKNVQISLNDNTFTVQSQMKNNIPYTFSNKNVLIGLSGGINSMAVLCWLSEIPKEHKPKELHLFYAHFEEHSPDTRLFVEAGFSFAKKNFENVFCEVSENSVMDYFEDKNFIPHPTISPCSSEMKIIPMLKYSYKHCIDVDLIGFVKNEKKRFERMQGKAKQDMFFQKQFPIIDQENEWCFEIVSKHIGWYPIIYDIKNEKNKRVFTHNNCLPCKNMTAKQLDNVKQYYPEYYNRAVEVEKNTGMYFGRSKTDIGCSVCKFD